MDSLNRTEHLYQVKNLENQKKQHKYKLKFITYHVNKLGDLYPLMNIHKYIYYIWINQTKYDEVGDIKVYWKWAQ